MHPVKCECFTHHKHLLNCEQRAVAAYFAMHDSPNDLDAVGTEFIYTHYECPMMKEDYALSP